MNRIEDEMATAQACSQRDRAEAERRYAEAKECLALEGDAREGEMGLKTCMRDLAEAQVHATLALAAATMALGPHR